MLSLVAVAAVTGFLLTARAIKASRWLHWWTFSPTWAGGGWLSVWALLCIVSVVGIVAARGLAGDNANFLSDLAGAASAQSALRRMRSEERGGTLALGFVPDVFSWVEQGVSNRVYDWAVGLDDAAIVRIAANVDRQTHGRPSEAGILQRAGWREEMVMLLTAGGTTYDQARADLNEYVSRGFSVYGLRKPS